MPTTVLGAAQAYIERFGSLDVSFLTLGDESDFGKRLIREANAAVESGKRMNEAAFERDFLATLPAGTLL